MGYELAARPVKCPTQPPRLRSGQRSCPGRVSSEGHQKARSARESGSALQPAKEAYSVPSSVLLGAKGNSTREHKFQTHGSWNECIGRGLTLAMENERSKWRTNIGEERTMNQNPNQKPGQQQQAGQQGGQEKPGQQQQGGQKPGQQQQGGQQGGQQNQQNR